MYILKDSKLYIQNGTNTMVGVNIYSDHIVQIKESAIEISPDCIYLTRFEVFVKFQINENNPYIFPYIKPILNESSKDVIQNESIGEVKKSTRKSRRK